MYFKDLVLRVHAVQFKVQIHQSLHSAWAVSRGFARRQAKEQGRWAQVFAVRLRAAPRIHDIYDFPFRIRAG